MLNATKVNAWIKKAAKKETRCFYHAEEMWVSDTFAVIMVADMPDSVKFTLQGIFGGLDESKVIHRQGGGSKASNVPSYKELLDPSPYAVKTVIDSRLRFEKPDAKPKIECRVLYDPETKEKVLIDQKYADLFKNFEDLKLVWHIPNVRSQLINLFEGERLVGLVAPIYYEMQSEKTILDTFEFVDQE